jgi:hypothetical protein
LHLACEKNCKEPLLVLLSSGLADLNSPDSDQQTPLTTAYFAEYWDLFEILVKSGSLLHPSILRHICKTGNLAAFNIISRYYDSKTLSHLIDTSSSTPTSTTTTTTSFLFLAIKYGKNLELIESLLSIGVSLTRHDLVELYTELNNNNKSLDNFLFYLECFILLVKHYTIEKTSATLTYTDLFELSGASSSSHSDLLVRIDLEEAQSALNFVLVVFLDRVLFEMGFSKAIFARLEANAMRLRLLYLSALVVYTAQLDVSKKYVQKWLSRRLQAVANDRELNEFKVRMSGIFKRSLASPWSLQMLCRATIRTQLKNVEYVLNDKSLVQALKVPNICVRYLKFEFI